MFSFHTTAEEFINATESPAILDLCLRKTGSEKSRDYRDVIVVEKLRFKMFSVHTKTKTRHFQIPVL